MSERIYLLPLWIRAWHWSNAVLIITLCITGISIHFVNPSAALVEFPLAVRIHNIAGLTLAGLYGFFVIANVVSGNWWQYVPKPPNILERCWRQVRFYCWGCFKGEHEPFPVTQAINFNALQSVIYLFVMFAILPVTVLTGLVYINPRYAPAEAFGVDGLLTVAVLHYLSAALILMFAIAHIYLGSMGTKLSSMYKTMITGWHEND